MNRGEVWRADLPTGRGHVQAGVRPVILIQNDSVTARVPTVLVVPLTGAGAAGRYPGTVLVQPDQQNGLTMPSVALVFQIQVLDQRNLLQPLGVVDPTTLDQVVAMLHSLVS